jgi:hypothetical protein
MDLIFTTQFWHDQWTVITSAPWLVIPLLLVAGLVGWKWKATNDDGEIRGLRAHRDATAEKLEVVREKYDTVVNQVNELRRIVVEQDNVIAELKKAPAAPARVVELLTTNTEIKNVLTNLSTSTSNLGEALSFISGSAQATLTSASPTVEIKPTYASGEGRLVELSVCVKS